MRIINLVKHNINWSSDYNNEISDIKDILQESIITAYHIGSTAISGISAKPVIDILLEVNSLNEIDKHNNKFKKIGYESKGEYGVKGRRFFQKGRDIRTHHLHIYDAGNLEIERHRLFVEFMNAHPEKVTEYEKLKIKLLKNYSNDPEKYSQGKTVFIQNVDSEAIKWKHI